MGFVYILQSLTNSRYYIGSTTNIPKRLHEHNDGKSPYTSSIRPLELLFSQEYPTIQQARRAESWLKKQKDKDFLKRIIKEGKITKGF